MSLEPVTGVNIINNLLKLVRLEIPINAPGISIISKMLMVRELKLYFMRIRKTDESLSFDKLDTYTE